MPPRSVLFAFVLGLIAVAAAAGFVTSPPAHAQPSPHQFFGDGGSGTGATIDGAPAPEFLQVDSPEEAMWLQGPAVTASRSVALTAGVNFVSWTGPELTPIGDALAGIAGVEAVFLWDAGSQSYLSYRPGAPAALNTLQALPYSAAVWVLVSADGVWEQPARDSS